MPVNITDTLHVTTTEGVLATADEIYDKSQRKFQSQINSEKLDVVIISYGYDESIDEDTFIDDMSVVLDSLERATSTDATLLMQRVSEYGNNTTYYGVVRNTGAGYEICWLLYEYPTFDNVIPALEARFFSVYVEYNAQSKPKIKTGYFLGVVSEYTENPDVFSKINTPVGYQVFYEQTINKQLKPSIEGTAGQVLTKTGPNPGDVKWVTPSSSASPYERISQADVVSVFQLDDDPDVPSGGGSLTLAGELADNTRIMIVGHVKIKDSAGVTTCYALSATYPVPLDSEVHIFDHGGTFVSATISGTTMTIYLETVNRDNCPEVTVTITGIYKLTI